MDKGDYNPRLIVVAIMLAIMATANLFFEFAPWWLNGILYIASLFFVVRYFVDPYVLPRLK